jgi:hypothetical protein
MDGLPARSLAEVANDSFLFVARLVDKSSCQLGLFFLRRGHSAPRRKESQYRLYSNYLEVNIVLLLLIIKLTIVLFRKNNPWAY